jgi:hypothetical protein
MKRPNHLLQAISDFSLTFSSAKIAVSGVRLQSGLSVGCWRAGIPPLVMSVLQLDSVKIRFARINRVAGGVDPDVMHTQRKCLLRFSAMVCTIIRFANSKVFDSVGCRV